MSSNFPVFVIQNGVEIMKIKRFLDSGRRVNLIKRHQATPQNPGGIKGRLLLIYLCVLFMFLFSLTPASMADPTACLSGQGIKYFTATIYHEKIDEDLTDFPVLLHLSDNCGTNGFDASELFDELSSNDDRKKIAVCAGEDTQCYVEIESWDSSNREAWLWVKVPEISGSENTILRLYYGQELTENDEYIGEASDHLSFQMVLDKGAEGTYDTFNAESASVIKDGDAYKMWYSGHDGAKYRILHATSMDGITWTVHQMVLNVGSEGTYDTSRVFHPCVI